MKTRTPLILALALAAIPAFASTFGDTPTPPSGMVVANVKNYGAKCDGTTDDTAAIQAALTASTNVYVPSGTCQVTGLTVANDNTTIFGDGVASVLKYYTFSTGVMLAAGTHPITLRNIKLDGLGTLAQAANVASPTNRTGVSMKSQVKSFVTDVVIEGFENYGIQFTDAATDRTAHVVVSNTIFRNNWTAIYILPNYSEYIRLDTLDIAGSRIALDIRSGNVIVANSKINDNAIGVNLVGTAIGNNAHGNFTGGQINHSGLNSIKCTDVTIGFNFTGVQINEGDILLDTCTGINITDGALDVDLINLKGGGRNYIANNFVYNGYTPTVVHSYSAVPDDTIVVGNYLANGTFLEDQWVKATSAGNVTVGGTLTSTGAATCSSTLDVRGALSNAGASNSGAVYVADDMIVQQASGGTAMIVRAPTDTSTCAEFRMQGASAGGTSSRYNCGSTASSAPYTSNVLDFFATGQDMVWAFNAAGGNDEVVRLDEDGFRNDNASQNGGAVKINDSLLIGADLKFGNTCTGTVATNAVTCSGNSGVITDDGTDINAGTTRASITWTNTLIASTSVVTLTQCSAQDTNSFIAGSVTPGSGAATLVLRNVGSGNFTSAGLKICFNVSN